EADYPLGVFLRDFGCLPATHIHQACKHPQDYGGILRLGIPYLPSAGLRTPPDLAHYLLNGSSRGAVYFIELLLRGVGYSQSADIVARGVLHDKVHHLRQASPL
ncbi:MAG: hypothetical protein K940chlam2_01834, partial [Chlamydiae bacterium]|nr:hypothetical protein [Chlamydiota bacterium]